MTTILTHPPDGYSELVKMFGDIRPYIKKDGTLGPAWEEDQIVRIQLPEAVPYAFDPRVVISRVTAHRLLADTVVEMHSTIHGRGLWHLMGPYGGGFVYRANRNASAKISTHAWGVAFDWDPVGFPNGSTKRRPIELSEIIKSYGFTMGEDFHGTKDPMHWQWCAGY